MKCFKTAESFFSTAEASNLDTSFADKNIKLFLHITLGFNFFISCYFL